MTTRWPRSAGPGGGHRAVFEVERESGGDAVVCYREADLAASDKNGEAVLEITAVDML